MGYKIYLLGTTTCIIFFWGNFPSQDFFAELSTRAQLISNGSYFLDFFVLLPLSIMRNFVFLKRNAVRLNDILQNFRTEFTTSFVFLQRNVKRLKERSPKFLLQKLRWLQGKGTKYRWKCMLWSFQSFLLFGWGAFLVQNTKIFRWQFHRRYQLSITHFNSNADLFIG